MIADALLAWYDRNARALPWRSPPGMPPPDAYRVWLSEVMLQQTTVAAVRPYFERFVARWPDVRALAAEDDSELMAAWAGLGYYSRARNLLTCARAVVAEHKGRFPDTAAALRRLPGIGDYTASAVAAIAFGEPASVVDGNVERVIARLFAIPTPMPGAKAEIRGRAADLTPTERPGDYAQAMMDLGATICTPRRPACALCPVRRDCRAFATGQPDAFPVRAPTLPRPVRRGLVFWIEAGNAVMLVRRPPKGLLGGMRGLPTTDWSAEPSVDAAPIEAGFTLLPKQVRHVFTHFALELDVAMTRLEMRCALPEGAEWWPLGALAEAGLPTVFAKAAQAALQGRDDDAES